MTLASCLDAVVLLSIWPAQPRYYLVGAVRERQDYFGAIGRSVVGGALFDRATNDRAALISIQGSPTSHLDFCRCGRLHHRPYLLGVCLPPATPG